MARTSLLEITKLYEERQEERKASRLQPFLSPMAAEIIEIVLERFRTSDKYRDRPVTADIAFCVAAYSTEPAASPHRTHAAGTLNGEAHHPPVDLLRPFPADEMGTFR